MLENDWLLANDWSFYNQNGEKKIQDIFMVEYNIFYKYFFINPSVRVQKKINKYGKKFFFSNSTGWIEILSNCYSSRKTLNKL